MITNERSRFWPTMRLVLYVWLVVCLIGWLVVGILVNWWQHWGAVTH
jgi:hypothetical protein